MSRVLKVPFNVNGGSVSSVRELDTIVEQKIINVLVTGKFERPMDPEYGAGVQSLLFDTIDELVQADFDIDARDELASNITGLRVLDIRVRQSADSEAEITVYYSTPLSPAKRTVFTVPISLLTEESEL